MSEPARNADGLVRLFGYAALERNYGWKRRTLENAVRAGKLRKPFYVGKEACWYANDIDDYLARLRGDLDELAVSSPDKIEPSDVETALGALATRWAAHNGVALPADAFVAIQAPMSSDQRDELLSSLETELTDAFARLDPLRAWIVIGGLMPVLRPVSDRFLQNMTGVAMTKTPGELRRLALDVLDQALANDFVGPE